jgi:iron only hydrogenase large subunit-like protein
MDKGIKVLAKALENKGSKKDKNQKIIALLAPSFVAEFSYPEIISQLHRLGFDKIVELTFGAKMVNREYHEQLKTSKQLIITSVCPGIVTTVNNKFPRYKKNLAKIDSPMIATAKICKKFYPKHKTCFISPCLFKKIEAQNSEYIDFCMTYQELNILSKRKDDLQQDKKDLSHNNKNFTSKNSPSFDRFYNDYTKIYPLSGGLSKTSHLKGIIKPGEEKIIDGIQDVEKFLTHPNKKIKFLDVTFCKGGCIGGPCVTNTLTIAQKKKKVLDYMNAEEHKKIPKNKEGLIEKAKGIKFSW